MFRIHSRSTLILVIVCAAFAGCRSGPSFSSQNQNSGTAPVVLAMTDTPPANVSILSAEVTLTGATLSPGNVPLFSGPTTIELTRLQTDVAYLTTATVNAGSYTSLTLTFSNPMLTFENDTTAPFVAGVGSPSCAAGAICTIQSVATNLSTTITLSNFKISANTGAGLLVDVNLNNLLSATLGADFKNAATVSQFTPAGSGAPPVGAEDVVGQVTSMDTVHKTFSFQNATGLFSLTVDNTTTFLQFPSNLCTTSVFTCLRDGQILSVDISFRADGTPVARNVLFEDADSSDIEVEGIVTGFNTGAQTITIVTLAESTAISGLNIGGPATVRYTALTPSDVDFIHADSTQVITTGFLFSVTVPADLIVGQQVQVRRNPTSSSNASITADRVRLRSSRVSGKITSVGAPFFQLGSIPSLFTTHAITQIQVQTSNPTIYAGTATIFTTLAVNNNVSVRGPLFANSGSPTLVASKVLQH